MKPPFGTLNARLAETIISNAPKYRAISEPFGDGGTLALELAKRKPKTHNLNVEDESLFSVFLTVQKLSISDRKRLKGFDWVASSETFDKAVAITATEGPEFLYRFLYLKKVGMKMAGADPADPPQFDVLSAGDDVSDVLMGLPIMKVGLKGVTLTNDDPMTHVSGGGDFLVLLPKKPEHVDAVKSRLGSLGGTFFFAEKVADGTEVIDLAKQYPTFIVSGQKVASIMMGSFAMVTNYDSGLVPIDLGEKGSGH